MAAGSGRLLYQSGGNPIRCPGACEGIMTGDWCSLPQLVSLERPSDWQSAHFADNHEATTSVCNLSQQSHTMKICVRTGHSTIGLGLIKDSTTVFSFKHSITYVSPMYVPVYYSPSVTSIVVKRFEDCYHNPWGRVYFLPTTQCLQGTCQACSHIAAGLVPPAMAS